MKSWQKHYTEFPYSERHGSSPEGYAKTMIEVFQTAGIINDIKERKVRILASSVSTGNKDIAFMKELDSRLGKLKQFQRPEAIFTDFAYKDPGPGRVGKPIIKLPRESLENINLRAVACNMFHVPLENNSVDVLYERLGALWHATGTDAVNGVPPGRIGRHTHELIGEYKRIVAPGGKIIIDWINLEAGLSTAARVAGCTIPNREGIKSRFEELGFEKVEFVGRGEGYLILTNPPKEKD